MLLPGKESRTSTHAMIVPTTALTKTTPSETRNVTRSAATACGLETASQKACAPPSVERSTTAARGTRTMRLR